jgi:hypothetical protein
MNENGGKCAQIRLKSGEFLNNLELPGQINQFWLTFLTDPFAAVKIAV